MHDPPVRARPGLATRRAKMGAFFTKKSWRCRRRRPRWRCLRNSCATGSATARRCRSWHEKAVVGVPALAHCKETNAYPAREPALDQRMRLSEPIEVSGPAPCVVDPGPRAPGNPIKVVHACVVAIQAEPDDPVVVRPLKRGPVADTKQRPGGDADVGRGGEQDRRDVLRNRTDDAHEFALMDRIRASAKKSNRCATRLKTNKASGLGVLRPFTSRSNSSWVGIRWSQIMQSSSSGRSTNVVMACWPDHRWVQFCSPRAGSAVAARGEATPAPNSIPRQ